MGTGEDAMRVWGYTAGSFCLTLGLLSLVLAILLLVLAKSDVTDSFKNDAVGFAAVVVVIAVVALILGAVTVWKIYLANQLYLRVSSEAALGHIVVQPAPPPPFVPTAPRPAPPPPPKSPRVPAPKPAPQPAAPSPQAGATAATDASDFFD